MELKNPGPLGQVRVVRLCLKNVLEIAVAIFLLILLSAM